MSSLQFPPSSPVLDGPEPYFDPFKGKEPPRGRFEYPTPNPSSTVGRSSSPARHEKDADLRLGEVAEISEESNVSGSHGSETRKMAAVTMASLPGRATEATPPVSINRDFNIVNPHALVMRVPLLAELPSVTIGRSSKTCDFHFKNIGARTDTTISRCHVKITHTNTQIALTCMGYNGFGVIIPRACVVKKVGEQLFELIESDTPLVAADVSKSVRLDHQHTEFHVSRGESVYMPRFANVLLQVGSHVLLVNPEDADEELTDDEAMVPMQKKSAVKPAKVAQIAPQTWTPLVAPVGVPQTPKKVSRPLVVEEPTPSKPHRSIAEKENVVSRPETSTRLATPLSNRSTNIPDHAFVKKRAQSEEPQGSMKKVRRTQEHDANGKLIIDELCLEGVQNIGAIENILINHLAFSRLSSTPALFLNTILAVVSKLTLQQLRVVLHKVECIGVIYRQGKDAAGKPLEEEYYYIPEKDRDPERNKLVSLVRGHGGLRACRKTHKQYYWKKPAPIKK